MSVALGGGEGMNGKQLGWILLLGGAAVQVAETMGKASAQLAGTQYQDSRVGQIITPIENFLPLSLGWTLIASGAILIWVLPRIGFGE